ncbi:methyltransferase [bacterium]|nr:methyltransferase [bacterium]
MTDWTAGYVADIGYTYGYYAELNPLRLGLAFAHAGLAFPRVGTACELGYGQGLSVNLHAAASPCSWHGTDFNPSQADFARELAADAGSSARLHDESFADFCGRPDLPDFDFIGLHGIWSWISDANRAVIVDFVRRKLRVGGVLYVSYNTLPGWAAFAPMRHLMTAHAQVLGAEGRGIISRIEGAIDFAERLYATKPAFARAQAPGWLAQVKGRSRNYLAHEYFNRDWCPMHFATMAEWLEPARVQFACSANYLEHIDTLNFTADQRAFLADIPNPMFRQTVRDFMVNQQFRKDYWVKGARTLSPREQAEALRAERVVLVTHRPDVPLKVGGALGDATLAESVYSPLLDLLADHRPRTLGEIELALKDGALPFARIVQAAMVLTGAGHMAPAQNAVSAAQSCSASERANAWLAGHARDSGDIGYLGSPVTGGGLAVGRVQQLFLLALRDGRKKPEDLGAAAWETLAAQGHRLIHEGRPLESPEENLARLSDLARAFAKSQLPVLKALKAV